MHGCKNWEPGKCVRCGAALGLSSCFDPIHFDMKEEADAFYNAKGGLGAAALQPAPNAKRKEMNRNHEL